MARRAGLFKHYRESGKAFLVISGPYEFLADDPVLYGIHAPEASQKKLPPAEDATRSFQAHNRLKVDLGWLSGKSADWLRKYAGQLPSGYELVGKDPLVRILTTQAGKIGIVLFPEGRQTGKAPDSATVEKVLAAGESLKGKVRLIVGISPWGYVGERDFLKKAEGVFGCILGGGEGIGFDFSPRHTPKILWVRPDTQGRAVNIIELLELPGFGDAPIWKQDETFRGYLEFLDDKFPADPEVERIVGNPPN